MVELPFNQGEARTLEEVRAHLVPTASAYDVEATQPINVPFPRAAVRFQASAETVFQP